ncbi:MAG: glycosyltransferase [Clostridiales bacterium]|nr:glycosyltransferase [Clostridiales bacterium]
MDPIYCKYSNDRDTKFQIKTSIELDENRKKVVYKYATTDLALTHIQKIYSNYNLMKNSFENTIFIPNKCELVEGGVKLEYVYGKTLEDYLDNLYLDGKHLEVIEKIKEFCDLLFSLEDNIDFEYSDDFELVFGKNTHFGKCKSLKVSNIDFIFGNILIGDKWTIIDYEWTFDFPIPIQYIIYRAIYYYVHGSTKRDELTKFNIFKLIGISDEEKSIYAEMELNFQKYVAGNKATLAKLKQTMLKRRENVRSSEHILDTDFVQVYFNCGDGFSEDNSIKKYYSFKQEKIKLSIPLKNNVKELRVDLATQPVIVTDLRISSDNTSLKMTYTNGINIGERLMIFDNDASEMVYSVTPDTTNIELEFSASAISEGCRSSFVNECVSVNERTKELEKELTQKITQLKGEMDTIAAEKERILNNYNQIAPEFNAMAQYIQRLHSRKIWRALSISKRTLKSVKHVGVINTVGKGCKKVKNRLNRKNNTSQVVVSNSSPAVNVNHTKKASNKKKILVVVHEAQRAGATLLSMNIIKTIKATTDYEPVILLMSGGPLTDKFKKQGICFELNQPNFNQIYDEAHLKKIVRDIASLGVNYALCNSVVTGLVLSELHSKNIKTITMVHELPTSIKAYNFVQAAKNVQKYSDDVVFAADFVRSQFITNFPMPSEKCHIIPQGVYSTFDLNNMDDKKKDKKKLCKQLGIADDSKIILGCGYGNFRKGLDWFGLIAINEMLNSSNTHFVWLGDKDKEFAEWINSDLSLKKLENRFHWMNFIDNPGYIFGATDIFILTSREDPFPSVALEAMKMYAPVIAFENAGGIPEVLGGDRGIVVPYGDCNAMVLAIDKLLNDNDYLKKIAINAKKYVVDITPENYIKNLLEVLVSGEIPFKKMPDLKVSVVIPNYNYEKFIPERLNSILTQTVRPHEIIFLDDVSKDNSIAVAKEILENAGISYRIIANETNQGCFNQWLNGIGNASGDIIWIAEADDVCEPYFIETLLPFFEDDQVNLAYGQSEVINEFGEHSGFIYTEYTNDLSETKWQNDYVNNGEAEIIDGLGIKNTIPNASGVLMRKSALLGIEKELSSFAISGDWFAYVYTIKNGKIAFSSDVLNYHRRHSTSIIHKREQDIKLFVELMRIKLFIAETFMIPESISERFINHVRNEYSRLMSETAPSFENQMELISLQSKLENVVASRMEKYSFLHNVPMKNLLFVIPDFEMGGGQTLVIRLANYFSKFHNVYMYNARPWLIEDRIVNMISEKVTILDSNGDPSQLQEYIKHYEIDTINDHIWWADKITYLAAKDLDTKIVLSMHGCYEALLQHPDWDGDFEKLAPKILNRANEVIYATNKNKKIFETVPVYEKTHLIHYGYEIESIPTKDRKSVGIDEDSYVYGLVARGIKEKGFGEAVDAFKILLNNTDKKVDLVLIGNGPFIDDLKKQNETESHIHFIDNLSKPSEWIGWVKTFDCALLPTYFVSESLPNSIIEYLAYSVPVISTNIGDIKYMIQSDDKEAGILLELHNGIVDSSELSSAMEAMLNDSEMYNRYKEGTNNLFEQFDIRNFAENYYSLY